MAKVAFGFFGQTRVSDVINVWYKKIEKDYDFFMSTWDDKNSQKLNFSFVEICKHNYDNELQKIQEDTPDYCFDKDTKKLTKITKALSSAYILFHIRSILNSIKKYEKENNFKYDAIILCRPDHIVEIDDLKLQLNRFLKQSEELDRLMISTQSPIILNDVSFTTPDDAVYILNNKAMDYMINLKKELFDDRLDLEIKFSYRGPHELIPFMVAKHNFLSIVSGLESKVIRTEQDFKSMKL